MRRLHILLGVWCLLLLAPAILMELGLFGPIDMHTSIPGSLAAAWIFGYLAQFAIFMWTMNVVSEQKVVWWLGGSLLPFAVDWTVPVSPLFFLLWLPILVGMAAWIAVATQHADSLQQHGVRAQGVVLEVLKPLMNVVINNVYIKRKLRLRIEREDGVPPYEGILNGLFMLGEIPSPGDRIPLVVDPAAPQRFDFDKQADSTSSTRNAGQAAAASAPRDDVAGALEKLAALRDRGALTSAEFEAAKKKVLRG